MPITSPRLLTRTLRQVPLEFEDPQSVLLAKAVQQVQERAILHPVEAVSVTATYTVLDGDLLILANATSGAFTVNLPTAAGREGRRIIVKKTDSSANAVTVDGFGSETIDGATTVSLTTQNALREMVSDNTNWRVLSTAGAGLTAFIIASVTLTANASTTTVTDSRLTTSSFIDFMPLTANAAAELALDTIARSTLVSKSVGQPLPNNVATILTWDVEERDPFDAHDNVINNSRLTVPAGWTEARAKCNVRWTINATGGRDVRVILNGSALTQGQGRSVVMAGGSDITQPVTSARFPVVTGDYFEVQCNQNSGASLTAGAGVNTWFELELFGGGSGSVIAPFVSTRSNGSCIITHSNNALTDRTYDLLVVG